MSENISILSGSIFIVSLIWGQILSIKIMHKIEPSATIISPIRWYRDYSAIKRAYKNSEIDDVELLKLIRKYNIIKIVSVVCIVVFILIAVVNSFIAA